MIHAVGPIWDNRASVNHNVNLLATAIMNTLKQANELECKTVSIPAISSGIFGFPKPLCAQVFFLVLKMFVAKTIKAGETLKLEHVRLCNFDTETTVIFREQFMKECPP